MTDQINDGMKLSMVGAIPVTPDMIAAGEKVWITCEDEDVECLQHVYRAMAALAPVELVSPGELAALKERDAALAMRNETMAALEVMREERDRAINEAAHRFTLFEVKALLAARPAPVPDTPKPKRNPFREFSDDRRRVGGLTA